MLLRRFKQLIVPCVSAVLLVAAGCQSCQFGRLCQNGQQCQAEQQAACQEDLACKKPKNGYVNEDEKNPLVARRNAKKDAKLNADGCSPDEERIPLLKRIADKSNRESDIEVIKVAAKIKHEEEMCQQKVKAVKYLGTIGCCCYDKDGQVAKALLEALNDCLPAVRLAAVQAIGGCVCGQAYARSCCNEEIAERLHEMAYGTDDRGCLVEPEPQIRQWAAYVAQQCPKKEPVKKSDDPKPLEGGSEGSGPDVPTTLIEEIPAQQSARVEYTSDLIEVEQEEMVAVEAEAEVEVEMEPTVTASFHQPVLFFTRSQHEATCQIQSAVAVPDPSVIDLTAYAVDTEESEVDATELTVVTEAVGEADAEAVFDEESTESQVEVVLEEPAVPTPIEVSTPAVEEPAPVRVVKKAEPAPVAVLKPAATAPRPAVQQVVAPQPVVQQPQPVVQSKPTAPAHRSVAPTGPRESLQGIIESVDMIGETATVRLAPNRIASANSRVHVVHKYALGRVQAIGEFEVVAAGAGTATIRPVAGSSLRKISVGDAASIQ